MQLLLQKPTVAHWTHKKKSNFSAFKSLMFHNKKHEDKCPLALLEAVLSFIFPDHVFQLHISLGSPLTCSDSSDRSKMKMQQSLLV